MVVLLAEDRINPWRRHQRGRRRVGGTTVGWRDVTRATVGKDLGPAAVQEVDPLRIGVPATTLDSSQAAFHLVDKVRGRLGGGHVDTPGRTDLAGARVDLALSVNQLGWRRCLLGGPVF